MNYLLPCLLLVSGVWSEDNAAINEKFTTALIKQLGGDGKQNVVFSPVSLQTALGIVAFGAKGKTEEQLFTGLGYNPSDAKQAIAAKQQKLSETPAAGAEWESANRVMVAEDLPVKKDYIDEILKAFPGSKVGNQDFSSPPAVAAEVNSWVSEKTKSVIKELITADSIDSRTKMIVLNAVYFKGEWKNGFDTKDTKKDCFYSEPGKCKMTDMMYTKNDFKYGYHSELKAQIIELPYKNERYSMIIVLPNDKTGSTLESVLANIDADEILKFMDEKKWPIEVHLTIPKFEIEFKSEMVDTLKKLGITDVFSDQSDLSGMISGLRAKVDKVIHKAKITVDEKGTVAAAATGVGFQPMIRPGPPPLSTYFIANRPFLFIVKDAQVGILFVGTYSY